ncbi:hypothetical protein CANCADRAFT_148385 [Tortispora caseinolytica NRRL Y-17796]|uniref:NADP-dependent oxidoreductase domain-containing protein n=1 Tax=Tortispora caseinolytica NRRL Y-17796 TaxID=767744 RepID=A0A1E4TAV0_9ASCO|nr:hypothetical protein CANCADRAFT_148385 [Tortispora caseinolytica NRRL Y-17796]
MVQQEVSVSKKDIPRLFIGGAVFNFQYTQHPEQVPVADLLQIAYDRGIRGIDTSEYYGPSEVLIGKALKKLNLPRNDLYIATKTGRIAIDQFDYSPEHIEMSVYRSLERLGIDYLDQVLAHDVEFAPREDVLVGIGRLFELKDKGLVHRVGVSGYPLDVLLDIAVRARKMYGRPLDVILSYCHYCLHNTTLLARVEEFKAAGVDVVINASLLSMGLLRNAPPPEFHPASADLKAAVAAAASEIKQKYNINLGDLALRFALKTWQGPSIIGCLSSEEVTVAAESAGSAPGTSSPELSDTDKECIDLFRSRLGDLYNTDWPSGL